MQPIDIELIYRQALAVANAEGHDRMKHHTVAMYHFSDKAELMGVRCHCGGIEYSLLAWKTHIESVWRAA